jgi:hypothetical protein
VLAADRNNATHGRPADVQAVGVGESGPVAGGRPEQHHHLARPHYLAVQFQVCLEAICHAMSAPKGGKP